MTPDEFQVAVDHHRAGRIAHAEAICRRCLAERPNHHAALHLLGVVDAAHRRFDVAIDLIQRAIALHATAADYHIHLAGAFVEVGRYVEAAASCRRALAIDPGSAEAFGVLGAAQFHLGQFDECVVSCRQALQIQPALVSVHRHLSPALQQLGRLNEAIASYRQIAIRQPSADVHCHLGSLMQDAGRLDDAIACFRRALALRADHPDAKAKLAELSPAEIDPAAFEAARQRAVDLWSQRRFLEAVDAFRLASSLRPDDPESHNNLGVVLQETRREDEALACYHRALELKPDFAEAHHNLGSSLQTLGRLDEAVERLRRALALKPNLIGAVVSLGSVLKDQGKLDEAIEQYHIALKLDPRSPTTNIHLAFAELLAGDLSNGLSRYEWRWQNPDFSSSPRNFPQPLWRGEPLAGTTILLHAEQGLGDTLQFIRYVPLVLERGGRVVVEGQASLGRLLARTFDVPWIDAGQPLPPFAVRAPLMSLPAAFGTTLETIPARTPYVWADAGAVESWRRRLGARNGLRVGLAWAGKAKHKNDRHRSMTLETLAPLGRVDGVEFFNLQIGDAGRQTGMSLVDWTGELRDFADTAALIANLDLVISVDTSVAHLAGAMGKPTWTLLPFAPDWRWLLERDDSPWYPTMRLFRQPKMGDWASVVETVGNALSQLSGC